MPSIGQVFACFVAIVVQLPVYLLVKAHMADDMTHVTVHPWYQWVMYLIWYIIYHDVIILISYAYTAEANVISNMITWMFGYIGVDIHRLFGLRSSCKKKRRKNRRKRPKVYSGYDELDQEEYDDQNQKHFQKDETYQDDTCGDQTKCDQFLKNLLALVPGIMAGQASHYERLMEQFKGTTSQ